MSITRKRPVLPSSSRVDATRDHHLRLLRLAGALQLGLDSGLLQEQMYPLGSQGLFGGGGVEERLGREPDGGGCGRGLVESFEVDGGGETTVRFERSVSTTGFHSGYVELSEDRLADDHGLDVG